MKLASVEFLSRDDALAPASIRPHTPQQAIRQAVYAFAAVAPQQGKMTMFILPTADTAMMTLFLQHVSQEFATSFVIMQVDPRRLASFRGITDPRKYSLDLSTGI